MAVLALTVGLVGAACGSGPDEDSTATATSPATTVDTTASTTTTTAATTTAPATSAAPETTTLPPTTATTTEPPAAVVDDQAFDENGAPTNDATWCRVAGELVDQANADLRPEGIIDSLYVIPPADGMWVSLRWSRAYSGPDAVRGPPDQLGIAFFYEEGEHWSFAETTWDPWIGQTEYVSDTNVDSSQYRARVTFDPYDPRLALDCPNPMGQ